MTLQVFNPVNAGDEVASASGDGQVAEQLLSECVAEIKQAREAARNASRGYDTPQAAAQAMLDELGFRLNRTVKVKDYTAGRAILNASPSQQAQVVLVAMASLVKNRYGDTVMDRLCHELLKSLLRRKLTYSAEAIAQMLTLVRADAMSCTTLPVLSILSNVQRHVEQHGRSKSIRNQLEQLSQTFEPHAYLADERKIGGRIKDLLDNVPAELKVPAELNVDLQVSTETIVRSPADEKGTFDIRTGEAWTNALLDELENLPADSRTNWQELLQHCKAANSSKPTKKWLKQAKAILDSIGQSEFTQVLIPALAAIGRAGESQRFNYGGHIHFGEPTQVHDTHADVLRGLVWATWHVNDEALIGVVGDAAEKCFQKIREVGPRCPKVGNACLFALSSSASESAVAQLARLKSRAKHVSTRKQIAKAFERAAETAGISEADLVELGVPRFGMTDPGRYREKFGEFTAQATLHPSRKTELTWIKSDGKTQQTVPATVKSDHGDALTALRKKLKDIDKLMLGVRHRIEALFLSGRNWSLRDFRSRFLDHPLVGVVARRLIWNLEVDETATPVVWHDGNFVDVNDQPIEASDEKLRVTIWHPMQSSSDEVLKWRQWLEANQVSQPFKQAHREIYILTDAERETSVYSNRFASHIVRQHQLAALCQQRGWRYDLQGTWDSWNAPCCELPKHGLRVEFFIEPLDELNEVSDSFVYTYLSTDQVRFLPRNPGGPLNLDLPVPLEDIPPLVFSEVMRDVDLFVGVTSVGNDPGWQARDDEAFIDYWQKFSFGALSQTALTRQQTLQRIVPRLEIGPQCRVEDRFLIVAGKLRTYKIHLGSGNVLMSPDDRYLCIVQKRGSGNKRTDNIYLPFEGDHTLSVIISKAFLLAHDDKIKDATIANQIRLDRT